MHVWESAGSHARNKQFCQKLLPKSFVRLPWQSGTPMS